MALNSTTGDPSAQSYVSVAEADAYFTTRINSDLWISLTTTQKEAALATATRRLDAEKYGSIKSHVTQALQWPRIGLTDLNGYPISATTMPKNLQYAVCEVAYWLLDEMMLTNRELDAFTSWNVGSISVNIRNGAANQLPAEARQFLKAIGDGAWIDAKRGFNSMVR